MKKPRKKDLEIRFYEDIVKQRPRFFEALSSLGDAYTRKGFYKQGLEVDKRLVTLKPQDPVVHYNLACSLSLVGDIDESLKALKKAVLLGYDDFSYMAKDPDLENVRAHRCFEKFLSKAKKHNDRK